MGDLRTETLRLEQAKIQLEQRKERELRELREKQKLEMGRVVDHQVSVKTDLEKAFEITISNSRDDHDRRLNELRSSQTKQMEDAKVQGEEEVEKVRSRYQEQIARYRQNSEKQLDEMRKQTQNTGNSIKRSRGEKIDS